MPSLHASNFYLKKQLLQKVRRKAIIQFPLPYLFSQDLSLEIPSTRYELRKERVVVAAIQTTECTPLLLEKNHCDEFPVFDNHIAISEKAIEEELAYLDPDIKPLPGRFILALNPLIFWFSRRKEERCQSRYLHYKKILQKIYFRSHTNFSYWIKIASTLGQWKGGSAQTIPYFNPREPIQWNEWRAWTRI